MNLKSSARFTTRRPKMPKGKKKRISKHDLEMEAQKQCSLCRKKCHHPEEERLSCTCACKLPNLRGNCLGFINKNDTFKRD